MAETPEAVALALWSELRTKDDEEKPKNAGDELALFARCLSTVKRGRVPASAD